MRKAVARDPVVYLLDGSPALTGAFVCARNIARGLAGKARVVLVIADDCTIGPDELSDFAAVKRLPIRPLRRSFRAAVFYLPALLISSIMMMRQMRRDAAQILIVNDFHLMHGAMCRLLGFRGRILTWVRINPAAFGRMSRIWLWAVRKTSDRIVAVSRYIDRLLPPGLATDLMYDAMDPRFELPMTAGAPARRTFVFLGNYIPGKGQDVALEAMCLAITEFPDLRLEFHGGDMGLQKNRAYRKALEARAEALGISDNLCFGDFVADPRSVMAGKLAAVNLSVSESFSMTVLEASACALPVIATRSGGPQEIINDGRTGFLIPLGDARACADAMIRLCRDPAEAGKMGTAGRERVLAEFSQSAFLKQLDALIDFDGMV